MTDTPNDKPKSAQRFSTGTLLIAGVIIGVLFVAAFAWMKTQDGTSSLSYCEQAWADNSIQASRDRPGTPEQIKRAYIANCEDGIRTSPNYRP